MFNEASTGGPDGPPYITLGIFAILVIGGVIQFISQPTTFSMIAGGVMVAAGVYGIADAVIKYRQKRVTR